MTREEADRLVWRVLDTSVWTESMPVTQAERMVQHGAAYDALIAALTAPPAGFPLPLPEGQLLAWEEGHPPRTHYCLSPHCIPCRQPWLLPAAKGGGK
jgi:hypothetical protein